MESVKGKNNPQIQDVNYLKVVEIISKLCKLSQGCANYLKVVEIISRLCKLSQGCGEAERVGEESTLNLLHAYLRLVQVLLMMLTIMLMLRIIKKTLVNLKIKMITREAKGRTRLIPVSQVSPQSFSKPTPFL